MLGMAVETLLSRCDPLRLTRRSRRRCLPSLLSCPSGKTTPRSETMMNSTGSLPAQAEQLKRSHMFEAALPRLAPWARPLRILCMLAALWPACALTQAVETAAEPRSPWELSLQYLGLTWHPEGGNTPEVYPLKLDRKAYLVLSVGAAVNIDYRLTDAFFVRLTSSLYKDCAFLTAGCIHAGPRLEHSWSGNSLNVGIGPILSFRRDWHRFEEYEDDEFYGDRVWRGWQYRLFWSAVEVEYLRRISDSMEFQWSIIPGAPLVITSMVGIRFKPG